MDNLDKRFSELEKRMDLIIANQLIAADCLDKISQAIKLIAFVFVSESKSVEVKEYVQ